MINTRFIAFCLLISLWPGLNAALGQELPSSQKNRRFTNPEVTRKVEKNLEQPQTEDRIQELEERIVTLYTNHKCAEIEGSTPVAAYDSLSPIVLATVAACISDINAAEALFQKAEQRRSGSDAIMLLHAHAIWKKDPERSVPLWTRLYNLTSRPPIKALARSYLSGTVENSEDILYTQTKHYSLSVQAGGGYASNPLSLPPSNPATDQSWTALMSASAIVEKLTETGSYGISYNANSTRCLQAHEGDLFDHSLDLVFTKRIDDNREITLRPFATYITVGNLPYQTYGGFALRGTSYHETHKQYMQGSVFQDWFFSKDMRPEAGTHYRFETGYSLSPNRFSLQTIGYFEHVKASRDNLDQEATSISYSHNDIGLSAFFEYRLFFTFVGLNASFATRQDDQTSYYAMRTLDGNLTSKRREDYTYGLRPTISIPFNEYVQFTAWYEYTHTVSTMGSIDYLDRNYENNIVAATVRATMADF